MRYGTVKRVLDFMIAAAALLFLSFPFAVTAFAICLDSPGPAIFRSRRFGRNGKPFFCLKFRTMYVSAPPSCPSLDMANASGYVTRIGVFLRRTGFDELPQLINVLRGEMSLIGYRPLVPEEAECHRMRHIIGIDTQRPGITGFAQISGRKMLLPAEKVLAEACYMQHASLRTDVSLMIATIRYICRNEFDLKESR